MNTVEISVDLAKRLISGNSSKGANALQLVDAWDAMLELEAIINNPLAAHSIAHDLLEALELITNIYSAMRESLSVKYAQDGWSAETRSIDQARAAIAKARGEKLAG